MGMEQLFGQRAHGLEVKALVHIQQALIVMALTFRLLLIILIKASRTHFDVFRPVND
jgi:hypothetical protein